MVEKQIQFENWRGMLWAFGAVLFASVVSITARGASLDVHSHLVVFYRSSAALALIVLWMIFNPKTRKQLRFSDPKIHILRGVFIGISTVFGFYALANIELAAATVLFGLAPVFATLVAVLIFGESIGIRRISAILVSFIGAVVIVDPRLEVELGMLSALGASVLFGAALAMSRDLARQDGVLSVLLSSLVMTVLCAACVSLPIITWPTDLPFWFWMIVLVVAGLLRQLADIEAYHYAEAAILAPIFYLRLIFIALGGYLLFDEIPKINTWIGATIVISATLYMTYRERRLMKA